MGETCVRFLSNPLRPVEQHWRFCSLNYETTLIRGQCITYRMWCACLVFTPSP